jgi:hypothetical protein
VTRDERRCAAWAVALAVAAALAGCGDDGGAGGEGGAGDGRYHPEPNGTRTSEDAACQSLKAGQEAQRDALGGCILTTRGCPDLLRAEFGAECLEYDVGSVDGCVAYYQDAEDCDGLAKSIADCVVTAYEGSGPAGCP